ncbi:nucleotidyltransferase substrate binding protein, HI0074 family [Natronincola peptidivorans]|uniref:Nucleotidyltransferase substrate binding protein, HI0074 family n=1 Tax=Natronincola peptidivorans TaxID=426128 RepID=A0A1I0G0L9_9FIRM|nr:nucleotidyltransferase substrate binding protein [Natronincola peptidivorans]SET64203.1 nucleotidyltransferase substrate binding protein, HI0074 family [Natronincola peptidivorans]
MNKLETKLINFKNALKRLKEAAEELKQEDASNVIRDGLIQRFEFTYELSWKTTKEYLEDIGIMDKNSPKAVIKEAYAQKLIVNEQDWLMMLSDRNMTSHVYKEEMAEEIAERIVNRYIKEFEMLLEKLQS